MEGSHSRGPCRRHAGEQDRFRWSPLASSPKNAAQSASGLVAGLQQHPSISPTADIRVMLQANCFAGLRMFLAVSFFLRAFPEDQVCKNTGFDCM
jgi:hypothetical protein